MVSLKVVNKMMITTNPKYQKVKFNNEWWLNLASVRILLWLKSSRWCLYIKASHFCLQCATASLQAWCLLLLMSLLHLSGTQGTFPVSSCCERKSVGGISYDLWGRNPEALKLGCKSDCLYKREDERDQMKVCFTAGSLKYSCLSTTHLPTNNATTLTSKSPDFCPADQPNIDKDCTLGMYCE